MADIRVLVKNKMYLSSPKSLSKRFFYKGEGKKTPRTPEGEFHRLRRIKPGHWHYLGHDIVKDDSGEWKVKPMIFYEDEEYASKTKDDLYYERHADYMTLCAEVVEIEDERETTK